jgi:hypothetical protein
VTGGGWQRTPLPTPGSPVRSLGPWAFQVGSRHVPVVGPTEALRGRAGGPGMAVPSGAVPGLPDPARRSSWQLAQEVWQESGVIWERTAPDLADPDPESPEPAHVDDPEPADADPADAGPAGTWFTGIGPADTRFAQARSIGDGPTATEALRPHFADSGVEPMTSDFPAVGHPRPARQPAVPPAASPADDPWTAAERTMSRGAAGRNPTRPEPIAEGLARDDVRRLGSQQQPDGFWPSQPRRPQQRPAPVWDEYPPTGYPGQAWPAGSGQVPLGAPVALDQQAPESVGRAGTFTEAGPDDTAQGWAGPAPLSEPDELFRAWQGSVNEAAAGRGPWSVPRRGGTASRRRRTLQAAAIGVPVAVIVTVGAGALMMLTGKANEMLAPRADTGSASPADTATGTSGTRVGGRATAGAVPPAFVGARFRGYPGQRGSVSVASIAAAAGVTLAVGTADGHPAIWRRSAGGSWTLESAAGLGAVTGGLGLASVAYGPAGWIAVGTSSHGGATEPVVLASADGAHWQPVTALTGQVGPDTLFLGAAASRAGYVVVGRQMIGGRAFAVLLHSADLRSWAADDNGGLDGRLQASTVNAVTATASGFVAVGSHGAAQSFWVSSDGRHWTLGYKPAPAGASSATLGSVAAVGAHVVAGGYADTPHGDIPVIVVSADAGAHWRQIVLQTPDGLGVITALTATPGGFTAAGLAGRAGAQHPVTWTSPDGQNWSAPAQAPGSVITALAAAGSTTAGSTAANSTVTGTAEEGSTPTLVALPAP